MANQKKEHKARQGFDSKKNKGKNRNKQTKGVHINKYANTEEAQKNATEVSSIQYKISNGLNGKHDKKIQEKRARENQSSWW